QSRDYVDCDLLVQGAVAAEARAYFLALWESSAVRPSRARAKPEELRQAAAQLDHHLALLAARIERARQDPARTDPPLAEVGVVRFLHDPVGPNDRGHEVGDALRALYAAARESLILESPYLVPTPLLRRTLADAIARGVHVRILTNSLAVTSNVLPQAAYV